MLRDPSNLIYRHNLNVINYEIAKKLFSKLNRTQQDTQKAFNIMKVILPTYNFLCEIDIHSSSFKSRNSQVRSAEVIQRQITFYQKVQAISEEQQFLITSEHLEEMQKYIQADKLKAQDHSDRKKQFQRKFMELQKRQKEAEQRKIKENERRKRA